MLNIVRESRDSICRETAGALRGFSGDAHDVARVRATAVQLLLAKSRGGSAEAAVRRGKA
jgi:hypothetical protein